MRDIVFCLMGPTAAGKTDLAISLTERYPFEIVSVDSVMIYRGMNIGAAKPSLQQLAKAPHRLIDCIDPIEAYSAARFCEEAEVQCQEISQKGNIPLLVGGTMMYFKALQQGLSKLPVSVPAIRNAIIEQAAIKGWPAMHEQLQQIDPFSAQAINPNDTQRIGRALEVYELSGQTLSALTKQQTHKNARQFVNLALFPNERSWLHERINRRFVEMLKEGLIDEVKGLLNKWPLHKDLPSMRAVGYRQVLEYLDLGMSSQELVEKGAAATRQLAKRQLTWLRHWPEISCYDPLEPDFASKLIAKVDEILDNIDF